VCANRLVRVVQDASATTEVASRAAVMRLCKPGFFFRLPVSFQPGEQGASSLCEEDYGLSGTLTLPQSFGDIYLGETFSCYISLCNSAPIQLSSVGLKVEVQTQLDPRASPSLHTCTL
jgi:hypothetical protein